MEYSLKEFNSPDQFKGYEELSTKFKQVLSGSNSKSTIADAGEGALEKSSASVGKAKKESFDSEGEDEDAMSYFEKLVDDE